MKKAFTLIELLVVISIIGILAAMVTLSFSTSQKQARNVTRKSDLAQYRNAIEAYANSHNGFFPTFAGGKVEPSTNFCSGAYSPPNEIVCSGPVDPKNSTDDTYYYQYQANTNGTEYVLWTTKLENSSKKWVVCSGGKSGETSTGLPPTSGTATCPI